jgi:hypothetical protein
MEFLDPSYKRSYNIRLFTGFFLSAAVIILGTLILSLITAGYTINTKTGQVIQNGLIFINSAPVPANVYVNSNLVTTTNARLELRAGNYNLSLYTPGYDTWKTNVYLLGGDVDQITYPLMVPVKPIVTSIAKYTTQPEVFSETPNQHWLLVSNPTTPNSFDVYDTTNTQTPVTNVVVPSNLLVSSAGTNTFSVVQWSSDNQNVLLEDSYNGAINYIVFNYLNPTSSYNLNQTFQTSFTSAKLLNGQAATPILFDQGTGDLYIGNQGAKTATLALGGVINYADYGNNKFIYATVDPKDSGMTSIKFSDLTHSYLIKDVNQSNKYLLDVVNYGGNYYYLIGGGGVYDYIYKNLPSNPPANNKLPFPFTLMVNDAQPAYVYNSTGQRYFSLQSGNNFSIYDILTQNHYRFSLKPNLSSPNPATWMDDNRLTSFSDGNMTIFGFDGTNIDTIAKATNLFNGIFSNNYNAAYYLDYTQSTSTWSVNRAGMIAGQP